MSKLGYLAVLASLQLFSSSAMAQGATTNCAEVEHHQFDFWVGSWNVFNTKGQLVAHSLIEPVYGCGIRENWMPIGKPGGGSLSIYLPDDKRWEQFWIDSSGARVIFTGGWNGSAMVIQGNWAGPLVRMTYSKNDDGSVRQFGEQSTDGGKTWKPSFDFEYKPSEAPAAK